MHDVMATQKIATSLQSGVGANVEHDIYKYIRHLYRAFVFLYVCTVRLGTGKAGCNLR